jgi:hypothetical protein
MAAHGHRGISGRLGGCPQGLFVWLGSAEPPRLGGHAAENAARSPDRGARPARRQQAPSAARHPRLVDRCGALGRHDPAGDRRMGAQLPLLRAGLGLPPPAYALRGHAVERFSFSQRARPRERLGPLLRRPAPGPRGRPGRLSAVLRRWQGASRHVFRRRGGRRGAGGGLPARRAARRRSGARRGPRRPTGTATASRCARSRSSTPPASGGRARRKSGASSACATSPAT